MSKLFGPLAKTRTPGSASKSKSVFDASLFHTSWKANVKNGKGETLLVAEHSILHPSGGIAYFHFMLDASFSTSMEVKTGGGKRVFECLLENFERLVEGGDTPLLPNDVIYVWTFNRKTTLLRRVEKKSFHAQLESIRAAYEKEMEGGNCLATHLYDAVATVMDKVRAEYKEHKKSDIFLVPFTDGEDVGSQASLDDMVNNVQGIGGRLHTIFITANMASASKLYERLESHQNEISHIKCETTEPTEISRAFNTLRGLIKSYLVMIQKKGDNIHTTRIAAYGADEDDVAEKILTSLHSEEESLLDGLYQLTIQRRNRIQDA